MSRLGYLDDLEYANSLIRRRTSKRNWSRALIRAELRSRGVDDDIIGVAFSDTDLADEVEVACRLARRLRIATEESFNTFVSRVAPRLARRGFTTAVVMAACRQVWQQPKA